MILLLLALVTFMSAVMAAGWAFQRAQANGGWTDVFWTFGTGLAAVLGSLWSLTGPPTPRQYLVAAMAGVWALRLGLYIARRVAGSKEEDARYRRFRQDWGEQFQARMFGFLQVQALASLLLLMAITAAARRPDDGLAWRDGLGLAIWLIALGGESLADLQLSRFKAEPSNRDKICQAGLWRWSRHPNYFFEWFGWLAYAVIAIDPSGRWPWGWAGLIGPVYMFYLLRFVTGVPPLEASMARSKGQAFEAYRRRTSIFFPLPPRGAA
jgi:steroid 5-alpha reductase family enzyme